MSTGHRTDDSRRRTLKGLAAATGLAALPAGALRAAGEAAADDMIRRPIPGTDESLPISGLGTARTFDVDPNDADAMARRRAVLEAFVAGGGRVVDSSPMYGHAETVLGRAAADLGATGRLFVATKVWTRGAESGREQMTRSFERLGVETMDLMQVHNLLDLETHLATLAAWKAEGRVRYVGLTHYTDARHDDLARLIERHPVDFVQFNYNIAARNAEDRLLPACADNGVAVIVNEPFEKGQLFSRVGDRPLPGWAADIGCRSWAQFFLKYIFGHPAVTCAIPATSDPGHAAENVAAGRGPLPDTATRRRMVAALAR